MPIRVLSVIHYPIFGGPHNRNAKVASFLASEDIKTTVLLPDEPGNAVDRLQKEGVEVVTTPLARIRAKLNPSYHFRLLFQFWGDVRRIRIIIREKNIDLVQINGLVNPQGAIAANLENVPVVWQILDTYAPMLLRRIMLLFLKKLADVVMCTGRQVANEHPGTTSFGDRLMFFYPPVNLDKFAWQAEKRRHACDALGLSHSSFIIGNVGNINLQKGHRTFIRAAARIKKNIPDAQFVILGAINENHQVYSQSLWSEAEELGLQMGVDLIVVDPGKNVPELEPAFDVFWMTSEPRSEGIPTVVEEAMALGIPVVATKAGSVSEVVLEGKSGFVVSPHDIQGLVDQTLLLYNNYALRTDMAKLARDFAVQNFGTERCARAHLEAYRFALAKHAQEVR